MHHLLEKHDIELIVDALYSYADDCEFAAQNGGGLLPHTRADCLDLIHQLKGDDDE
jgi:hypothetical protein